MIVLDLELITNNIIIIIVEILHILPIEENYPLNVYYYI